MLYLYYTIYYIDIDMDIDTIDTIDTIDAMQNKKRNANKQEKRKKEKGVNKRENTAEPIS